MGWLKGALWRLDTETGKELEVEPIGLKSPWIGWGQAICGPMTTTLRQDFLDHVAVHIGQPKLAALVFEREPLVIDSQLMQNRGMQIMDVNRVFDNVVAVGIGRSMNGSAFDPAAGHPQAEASRMMIATKIVGRQFALTVIRPSKFPAPDDERIFQQAAPRKSLTNAAEA